MKMKIPKKAIKSAAIESLRTVYDPEISVNIYDLGLIYKLEIDDNGVADVQMTLTSPLCPVADILPMEVEDRLKNSAGITDVHIEMVWHPQWSIDQMSDAAKLELNML
jgi:FeS assembly SUF system protein